MKPVQTVEGQKRELHAESYGWLRNYVAMLLDASRDGVANTHGSELWKDRAIRTVILLGRAIVRKQL